MMTLARKLWLGIFVLIILTPLGLILPDYFKAGDAWGEKKILTLWNAPLPDYSFKGWEGRGIVHLSFAYMVAAVVGIAVITGIVFIIGRLLTSDKSADKQVRGKID